MAESFSFSFTLVSVIPFAHPAAPSYCSTQLLANSYTMGEYIKEEKKKGNGNFSFNFPTSIILPSNV